MVELKNLSIKSLKKRRYCIYNTCLVIIIYLLNFILLLLKKRGALMGNVLRIPVVLSLSLLIFISGCKISGTVTDDGKPAAGVKIILSGDKSASVITDENGMYSFTVISGDYTVSISADSGGVFFPSEKAVFVKPYKKATANFTMLSDASSSWDPSITVPIQAHSEVRGYKTLRGIIHLHSVFSHDACDNLPFIDGKPNEVLLPAQGSYMQHQSAICNAYRSCQPFFRV
jgi:hypothetical protein